MLDWGFWTKAERNYAREFYGSRNIAFEIHYIDVSDEIWSERLNKRNREIEAGEVEAYYVDDNLAKKVENLFEIPGEDETDILYISRKV